MKVFFIIIKNISICIFGIFILASMLTYLNVDKDGIEVSLCALAILGYTLSSSLLEIIKEIESI